MKTGSKNLLLDNVVFNCGTTDVAEVGTARQIIAHSAKAASVIYSLGLESKTRLIAINPYHHRFHRFFLI